MGKSFSNCMCIDGDLVNFKVILLTRATHQIRREERRLRRLRLVVIEVAAGAASSAST